MDYIEKYSAHLKITEITSLRAEREKWAADPKFETFRAALNELDPAITTHVILDQDIVEIGLPEELSPEQQQIFHEALRVFIPWKKGPFKLFGTTIDSEWRSDVKWQRIKSNIGSLEGLRLADIGCHNGYFMFRMAAENPELVVGFEPYVKNFLNFQLIQRFAKVPNLHYELLGTEHIHYYPKFFDKVFCLGILYHQTDPIETLRKIFQSLKPGGEIIIDCQGVTGTDPTALVPSGRYAQARGIWYLPTISCLHNWLKRTQFRDIDCFYDEALGVDEQRSTEWAPIRSLADFLNPEDMSKTVEGYPAPRRFYVRAKK